MILRLLVLIAFIVFAGYGAHVMEHQFGEMAWFLWTVIVCGMGGFYVGVQIAK